jgi:type I restriction enzyme, S subunit
MNEWQTEPLDACLEALLDYRGKSPPKSPKGIPVLSAKVVKTTGLLRPIEQKIATDYYPQWMVRGLPRVGDVVMTTEAPMGEVIQLDSETVQYALGQRIVCMRGKEKKLDNTFLRYLLTSPRQQAILASYATGTTVLGISQKALRSVPISYPNFSEQRRIGELLGALDDKIELNRQMNETLEAMARAMFKDWFVDFGPTRAKMEGRAPYLTAEIWSLFPDSLDADGKPDGWVNSTIGQEVDVVGGSTPSTKEAAFWGGDIAWTTPKDLSSLSNPVLLGTARQITETGLAQIGSGLLPVGTVLLSSRAPIGYLAIAQIPVAVNQGFIAMVCKERLSNVFVWLWTQANMDTVHQNANGSTFQEISKANFRPIGVTVATPEVLRAFDEVAMPIFERIVANEKESRTLAATRELLLPKLMSGEVRVKDAERHIREAT